MIISFSFLYGCEKKSVNAGKIDDDFYSFAAVNFENSRNKKEFEHSIDIISVCGCTLSFKNEIEIEYPEYSVYFTPYSDEEEKANAVFYKKDVFKIKKKNTVWLSEKMTESSKPEGALDYSLLSYLLLSGNKGDVSIFCANLDKNDGIRDMQLEIISNRILSYKSYFPLIITGNMNISKENKVFLKEGIGLKEESDSIFTSSVEMTECENGNGYYIALQDTDLSINLNGKMIALTYDDGPSSEEYTEKILDSLEKNKAKATFFVLGSRASKSKDILKRAFDLGCEIGNHTNNHDRFPDNNLYVISNSIETTKYSIEQAIGVTPFLVRPPGGAYLDPTGSVCKINYPIILWTVDTFDYQNGKTSDDVLKTVKDNAYNGAIILMHDIHSPSSESSDEMIMYLQNEGFQLVTVSELIEFSQDGIEKNTVYSSAQRKVSK